MMKKEITKKLGRVVVLDDEDFFLEYFTSIVEKNVDHLSLYKCENEFVEREDINSMAKTDLLILDYRLKNKTIVSLRLLEFIRQDLNYGGPLLVVSTLKHFATDHRTIDTYATAYVDKCNLAWPALLKSAGF